DQYDIIDKHTQSGLELVEKYVKFVKERTEIEQNYAKQLRNLTKKYNPKRGSKEEQECSICRRPRKPSRVWRAPISSSTSKKRFEREWREADKAAQYAEKTDQDINATKADVEKAKQQANMRTHIAEECKNDYAAQLQKYNKEQSQFYFSDMPLIFNKLQDMDERRVRKLAQGYVLFSDTEKHVIPIIGKCLEGVAKAGTNVNERNDSIALIEQYKSGFERPGDLDFEDYSQGINRASSDSSLGTLGTPKGPLELLGKNRSKPFWLFSKKSKLSPSPSSLTPLSTPPAPSPANGPPSPKFGRDPLSYCLKEINKTVKPRISSFRTLGRSPTVTEDFGHLPPEQRRKRLQQKLDDIGKELQKEVDQSEALGKMKDVYEKNPQMGDPASLSTQINQTAQNMERLRGELNKGRKARGYDAQERYVTRGYVELQVSLLQRQRQHSRTIQAIYAEFDDDFEEEEEEEEEELVAPIGQCTAMYNFPGASEGTIAMQEGEVLSVVEEDKGDGWTRVRRANGNEGYIPTSYVSISLSK
ncbi:unnamed protein product, partial [Coregonus sp. 'balchen']